MKRNSLPLHLLVPGLICTFLSLVSLPLRGQDTESLLDKLCKDPNFYQSKLSPDGKHLAFHVEHKRKRSISILNLESMTLSGLTVSMGEDIDDLHWIDNHRLVYHVSKWGIYSIGLYGYNLEKSKSFEVLDSAEDKLIYKGMVHPLPQIPEQMVINAARVGATGRSSGGEDLYRVDLEKGKITRIAENTGQIVHWIVDAGGNLLYGIESRGMILHTLRWDASGSGWIRGKEWPEAVYPLEAMDESIMICRVLNEAGYKGIQMYDLRSDQLLGKPRYLPRNDMTVGGWLRDSSNYNIVGKEIHQEQPVNFWFNASLAQVGAYLRNSFPGKNIEFVGLDPAKSYFYFILSSDIQPGELYRLNLEDGIPTRLLGQYPDLRDVQFRPMQPVDISTREEDRTLPGYLTVPEGEGPFPGVLWIHGGPAVRDTWGFDPFVQLLVSEGYAVLQVNYRGSKGYGAQHGPFPLSQSAVMALMDLRDAADWLGKEGIAQPDKIVAAGASFGAYLATMSVAVDENPFCGAIGCMGVYDLNELYKKDTRKDYMFTDDLYLDYNEETYARFSPVNNVEDIRVPILILHGAADQRVGCKQGKRMAKAMRKADRDVEFKQYTWGIHSWPEERERPEYFGRILRFLERVTGAGPRTGRICSQS